LLTRFVLPLRSLLRGVGIADGANGGCLLVSRCLDRISSLRNFSGCVRMWRGNRSGDFCFFRGNFTA